MRVLGIHDGKAGHRNQVRTVAGLLGEAVLLGPGDPEVRTPVDLVVCAGTRAQGRAVRSSWRFRCPAVCLMRPSPIWGPFFRVVVLPWHARGHGPRIVRTPVAPSLPGPVAQEAGDAIAVFVGGTARGRRPTMESLFACLEAARRSGRRVLLTDSRRTPPALREGIRQRFREFGETWVYTPWEEGNPFSRFLKMARHVLVTEDSFNMVSEVILAGRVPFVLAWLPGTKLRRSYALLAGKGWLQWGDAAGWARFLERTPGRTPGPAILEPLRDEIIKKVGGRV